MKHFKPLGIFFIGMTVLLIVLVLTPNTGESYILNLKLAVTMVILVCTLILTGKAWPDNKKQ